MSKNTKKKRVRILRNKGRKVTKRLKKRNYKDQLKPIITASNIHYEISEKTNAMNYGGIGAIHTMVNQIGLVDQINENLNLLKTHLPYHESDHVLNICYNALLGGQRLEDIDIRRNDLTFLDALGAERIPDPTTAGDFTRRFEPEDIETLMVCINKSREKVWSKGCRSKLKEAFIDADGTIAGTLAQVSYKFTDFDVFCKYFRLKSHLSNRAIPLK